MEGQPQCFLLILTSCTFLRNSIISLLSLPWLCNIISSPFPSAGKHKNIQVSLLVPHIFPSILRMPVMAFKRNETIWPKILRLLSNLQGFLLNPVSMAMFLLQWQSWGEQSAGLITKQPDSCAPSQQYKIQLRHLTVKKCFPECPRQ